MPKRLESGAAGFAAAFAALVADTRLTETDLAATVAEIIAAVRGGGDVALADLTRRLDRWDASAQTLTLEADRLEAAARKVAGPTLDALKLAARRIEAFHRPMLPQDRRWVDEAGVTLGWRWTPVDAVGLYVPGGLAAYPSSLLMNAVPARVAGVERIAICTPTPDGAINPLVLAAAHVAGIAEVHLVGGAQAVAALAYGTETIRPVDLIVGPGNAYVAAAKRAVFGRVGIDSIAGPSEVVVVADGAQNPTIVALDLLAQAEHDPVAQAILIADDANFAARVEAEVEAALADAPRAAIARASWERYGAIIVVGDLLAEAPSLVDRLAPEHLELMLADPEPLLARIRHAGAIFLGPHAPEALGDYVAGPDHVLPTARTARFASGLSVFEFLKRTTLIGASPAALAALGPAAIALAEAEGLQMHGRSIAQRLLPPPRP